MRDRYLELFALTLFLAALALPGREDVHSEFKSWLRKYKKGDIELYQPSKVPIPQPDGTTVRYFKSDNQTILAGLLDRLAERNDLKATQLLVEAAHFRFDRNSELEIKRHYKQQPWILRAQALEALGKITDKESLEWLRNRCLRSDSGWEAPFRRVIAASVFGMGRTQEDSALLMSLLDDRDPRVREKALSGLGESGGIKELDTVIKGLKDEVGSVRVAALDAVGEILTRTHQAFPTLADKCLEEAAPLLSDPEWPVQEAAITLMERFRSERSIPVLITFLERSASDSRMASERIIQRTAEVLRSLTGAPITDADFLKWKTWWSESRDAFKLAPAPEEEGFQVDAAVFFNIPVNSDRVFFILDVSGSMAAPLSTSDAGVDQPVTVIDRAKEELLNTLSTLDQGVRFNIILFNDSIRRFSDEPILVDEESLEKARAFIEETEVKSGTNIFDALNQALQIKSMGLVNRFGDRLSMDTIFLLSDGVPTTGLVIDPDEILRIITKANRTSKIKIHTVYLGSTPSPFMRDLAKQNYGRFVHIK